MKIEFKYTDMIIDELGFSKRPLRVLRENGIVTLGQLIKRGRSIHVFHGLGKKSQREIFDILRMKGMDIPRKYKSPVQEQEYLNELFNKINKGLEDEQQ